jgi:hypothetical protein
MISGRATFACICYAASLPVPSKAFDIARVLMTTPESRWLRFLSEVVATYPEGSPEHDTAVEFQRIIRSDGAEVAA